MERGIGKRLPGGLEYLDVKVIMLCSNVLPSVLKVCTLDTYHSSAQFLYKMPVKTSVTSNVVVVVDRLRGGWTRLMQWAGTAQAQSPPSPPSTPSTAPGSILDRFNKD